MSDTESFDKEAEREKLREQFRREEENRRSTEHMSELLLKGATMTNRHCDTCGDPLFRYEGQEFCPTCTREGEPAESAASGSAADADEPADGGIDRVAVGGGDEPASASRGTAAPPASAGATPGDVGEARAALVRKLTALARQAEATEDVGRSRELLAAAREAAEALAAIDALGG